MLLFDRGKAHGGRNPRGVSLSAPASPPLPLPSTLSTVRKEALLANTDSLLVLPPPPLLPAPSNKSGVELTRVAEVEATEEKLVITTDGGN